MSEERISVAGGALQVAKVLYDVVVNEILPGSGVDETQLWVGLAAIVNDFAPRNRELLNTRAALQEKIDAWHKAHPGQFDQAEYKAMLRTIGYIEDEVEDFRISTQNVDPEIACMPAPQLVVPIDNARYALNAANARWGSLFDALYGTDVIGDEDGLAKGGSYNDKRGDAVFERAAQFLDTAFPLADKKHADVDSYTLKQDDDGRVHLVCGKELARGHKVVGFRGSLDAPECILLVHEGLHVEIHVDRAHAIGGKHKAGVKDIVLEAAVTTIQDCEDSVAAVDAEDKARVYSNWNGIMRGTLTCEFAKGGKTVSRRLKADREFISAADGKTPLKMAGRSVLLVRNVGIHMYSDAIVTAAGDEVPEGLLDAMFTSLGSLHDLRAKADAPIRNSRAGSMYIVKPKMHGSAEVRFTVELLHRVEQTLRLPRNTLKLGIMDEERRTTVNLKRCIGEARERVVFINTGFLDRTGDEIHTSMAAGAMVRKGDMKALPWLDAYERWNVDIGLACGLKGVAQIGKGMWAKPDEMANMLATKIGHLQAGATCAWVPSPTAATLHAMHYHQLSVSSQQDKLAKRECAALDDILLIPLLGDAKPTAEQIAQDLENNVQAILGYVARWMNGVGCSKVPNRTGVGLMEDRATLRINAGHLANWLHHGIISEAQLRKVYEEMAVIVDSQNKDDANYKPMAPSFDKSHAFQAAWDLTLTSVKEPQGYTETVLHARRRQVKAEQKK